MFKALRKTCKGCQRKDKRKPGEIEREKVTKTLDNADVPVVVLLLVLAPKPPKPPVVLLFCWPKPPKPPPPKDIVSGVAVAMKGRWVCCGGNATGESTQSREGKGVARPTRRAVTIANGG